MNFYSGAPVHRVSHLRADADWLARRLNDPASRLYPVWRDRNMVAAGRPEDATVRAGYVTVARAAVLIERGHLVALLGESDGVAHFAVDLSHLDDPLTVPELAEGGEFANLREVSPALGQGEAALLAYAKGLMHWHSRHLYCGICGHPTESRSGGHVRVCTNPNCGASHFPRTDPAVIMLVSRGDRCLMGHNRRFPQKLYSALAGFVEPGESLEEAVAREVMEETGIEVGAVHYHSSQPWPFPASIMLGFHAEGLSEEIIVDNDELKDARWFSRDEVRNFEALGLMLPRPDSIARQLVEHWLKQG